MTPGRTAQRSIDQLAAGIAHTMLAAPEWTFDALGDACGRALGSRPGWLWPLVDRVLASYHRPPADASRELARFIAGTRALGDALEAARVDGRTITLRHLEPTPARSVANAARGVPVIDGLDGLADFLHVTPGQLDWLTDTSHYNRRTQRGRLHHYSYDWLRREGRAPRLLEVPSRRMREAQRLVHAQILAPLPLHEAAHGFVPSRSAITGATAHVGAETLITLDLSTFFAAVPARRIFGIVRRAGYPEAVAHALTGICTHAVPSWVIARMPPGGSPEERTALRAALTRSHLPQGSPTSPALSNLAVRTLDGRLDGWAKASGLAYTRYADDLAFSGPRLGTRTAASFIAGAERIALAEGHRVNRRKTRVSGAGTRQSVTGIVVNQRTNTTRESFDEMKAILYNCRTRGPASQNRLEHPDFRAHLAGRIAWVAALNPDRGARLRRDFDLIDWA